jgi:hypothetical protein
MDFSSLKFTIDLLVVMSGFATWIIFIPQIRLLLSVKDSKSISLWTTGLSWGLQVLILLQALLNYNWPLVFTMGVGIFFLTVVILIILYYRQYPGGRA